MAGTLPPGITLRHRKACAARKGTRCSCEPGYFVRIRVDGGGRTSGMFDTLDEAEAFLAEQRGAGSQKPIGLLSKTVRAMGDQLIQDMQASPPRVLNRDGNPYKPKVIRDYERDLTTSIYPLIGGKLVATITPRDIEDLVHKLAAQGRRDTRDTYKDSIAPLAASTIRNRLKPLQVICRKARLQGILTTDPFEPVSLPSPGGYRERVVPKGDVVRMYESIDDPIVRCAWAIFLLTGMRLGEALALRWEDVGDRVIEVSASWTSTRDYKGRVAPKTRRSIRKVPLSGLLASELDRLRAYRASTGRQEQPEWMILHGDSPSVPISAQTIHRKANTSWLAATPPLESFTPHEARHTYASQMIASGRPMEQVAREIGDSPTTLERRYLHLVPGAMQAAADEIDDLYG